MRISQYAVCGRNVNYSYQYRIDSIAKLSPDISKPPYKKECLQEHKASTFIYTEGRIVNEDLIRTKKE